ncbi:MAG TPA: type II toxin-antitoxin system prevent-host-death family antitoxin [Verrucomicrobiae bacterium]|nr:type II toxin-antitoxin system prevent-host-death family antitoxin [Verrucomicrobiae bacterium]
MKRQLDKNKRGRISLLMLQTREIGAADFKARCLELMDEVERLGIEIIITKHRKPVARLVPVRSISGSFVGSMKGMAVVLGDIVGPTGEEWEADESNLT